jgi:hypothetical protein
MRFWYLVAVYIHIVTAGVWLGAMLFEDPASNRFMCRIVDRIHGIGWVSLAILTVTGVFMLYVRGLAHLELYDIVSGRFLAERWGQVYTAKLAFVALLAGLQVVNGHKASRALYGFLASMLAVVALSVWIARPLL